MLKYGTITVEGAKVPLQDNNEWGGFWAFTTKDKMDKMKAVTTHKSFTIQGGKKIKIPVSAYFHLNGNINTTLQTGKQILPIDISRSSKECELNCTFYSKEKISSL